MSTRTRGGGGGVSEGIGQAKPKTRALKRKDDEDDGDDKPSKKSKILKDQIPLTVSSSADANNNRRNETSRISLSASRKSFIKLENKLQIEPVHNLGNGKVYTFGSNVAGQLGMIANQRKFPALVEDLMDINVVQVCTGAMHTVALTTNGKVYTFGCNDDHALGREAEEDEDMRKPGIVNLPYKIVQITAGDCHTAVLTEHGQVYIWGVFRGADGNFGLLPGEREKLVKFPERIYPHPESNTKIIKIASGDNHFVMLSELGLVYTCGINDVGQLGRELITRSTRGRQGGTTDNNEFYLNPCEVKFIKFVIDIWAGGSMTFFKTNAKGQLWACGMNSTNQLAIDSKKVGETVLLPKRCKGFDGKDWSQIAIGNYHILALDTHGKVYAHGQGHDGRLGLGKEITTSGQNLCQPTLIPKLSTTRCIQIACGSSVSYAITKEFKLYAWGFGENWQLGNGEEDDQNEPTLCVESRNAERINSNVIYVSGGSQHTAIILKS